MSGKQLSYLHTPADDRYRYYTVPERMQYLAEENPDREVYVFLYPDGRRDSISVSTLFEKSKTFAISLIKLGLKKGDIVATCLPNDKNALISSFGVIFAGGIISNMVLRKKDGTELQQTLTKLDVKYLIIDPGDNEEQLTVCMKFIDKIDKNGKAQSNKVPSLQVVITTSPVNGKNLLLLNDLLTETDDDVHPPRLDADENIVIFTTSGTTGERKFVAHTHHNIMLIGQHMKKAFSYEQHHVLYSERRIAWVAGFPFMLLHDCPKVVTKTHPIIDYTEHSKFTFNALLSEKCDITCLLPSTVPGMLCMAPTMPVRQILKSINVGGHPLASSIMNAIGEITKEVNNVYGMSEFGVLTCNHVKETETYIEFNAGIPVAGCEIKVVNVDGFIVEKGHTGEILARSPSMAKVYYTGRDATVPVSLTTGWLNTGDVGYITRDGELVVAGRQSDTVGVLYKGGRCMRGMVSYLEALIKNHPGVLDVVAVTVPDDVLAEIVCACVIPIPGINITAADLEHFCKSKMGPGVDGWKDHEKVMMFESFPRLYTGKPDKRTLRKEVVRRRDEEMKY